MATAEELGIDDVYEVVTETFGLDGTRHKSEFRMFCPDPDHMEAHPSCDVNLDTGLWNCFSCPAHGDLIKLGSVVLGHPRSSVYKMLAPHEPDAIKAGLQRRVEAARRLVVPKRRGHAPEAVLVPPEGSYEDGPLDALRDRGFTKKTIRRWGIRFAPLVTLYREDNRPFELTSAIAIPVLSETGQMLAWCYRATNDSERWFQKVRYIYTPGVTEVLNHHWFGMNHHANANEIAICEGALDAMWCDQNGIPAVAILGSQVKQVAKVRKLMNFRKVVLIPDRDFAGVTTAFGLGEALQARGVATSVARYSSWMLNRQGEPAKDAQDLSGVDLELVHARAIPFLVWKQTGIERAA